MRVLTKGMSNSENWGVAGYDAPRLENIRYTTAFSSYALPRSNYHRYFGIVVFRLPGNCALQLKGFNVGIRAGSTTGVEFLGVNTSYSPCPALSKGRANCGQ